MAVQKLIGTELDQIGTSILKHPVYKVLLFDPYADTFSNVVLDTYQQVPFDITRFVIDLQISIAHDSESNQATVTVGAKDGYNSLDFGLLMNSWVKVYEGDLRVAEDAWPVVFAGVFRGQPSRDNIRGTLSQFSNTAYDRSIFFREKRITSPDVWRPEGSVVNLGDICVEIATSAVWGMGLDRQEVLFGKFYRGGTYTTATGGTAVVGGEEYRINKKLQVVDIPPMEALTNIMQAASLSPAFNGEGKLVARPRNLDRVPLRVYSDNTLINKVSIPQNTMDVLNSVKVTGLDFRVSRVDYNYQNLLTIGPVTIGMFDGSIVTNQTYSDDRDFRAVPDVRGTNVVTRGSLLATIFAFDNRINVLVSPTDDFECQITIRFYGADYATFVVSFLLVAYIGLRLTVDAVGEIFPALGFALDASATILLMLVMETMRSIGTINFEVWGTPFEYVYQELEAVARLSDVLREEESETEIKNFVLGSLQECEDLAQSELRYRVAQSANRSITIATDQLLEPNDIIELDEEGEVARYLILEINKQFARGSSSPTYDLTVFRCR